MIYFSAFAGTPAMVDRCFSEVETNITAATPIRQGGVVYRHLSADRRWGVVAHAALDALATTRFVRLRDGCVVVNGPVLEFAGRRGDAAIQAIVDALADGDLQTVYEGIEGNFSVGGYLPRHGLFGFGDFSGLCPTYFRETKGLTVVGNKPGVVGLGRDTPEWDKDSLSWLIGHANIFGPATPVRGVNLMEPGTYLCTDSGTRREILPFQSVWPQQNTGLQDNLSSAEWDEITHQLLANMKAASALLPNPNLALTGGKDSRLVLALAAAAAGRKNLLTHTNGNPENPDVECASFVSKSFDVAHKVNLPKATSMADPADMWRILSYHTARFDGLICPWDGRSQNLSGSSVELSGFGGEFYRGSHAKQFTKTLPADIAAAKQAWRNYHQPFDPLGILRRRFADYQNEWTDNWVAAQPDHLSVLPEKFYVNYRLGHWSGPLMQSVPGKVKLAPLLSIKVALLFGKLKHRARVAERFHYEVMRRAAPALVRLPFMNQCWHPDILAEDDTLSPAVFQTNERASPEFLAPQQMQFVHGESARIKSFLLDAKPAVDEIFDVEKLASLLDEPGKLQRVVDLKAVLSALSITHSLLELGEMPVDDVR